MKKLLIAVAVLFASKSGFAQNVTFGVKAGLNLADMQFKSEGMSMNTESLVNFQIGGFADIPVNNFSIQPGLILNGKGGKIGFGDVETKTSLMYLEVPVNAYYNVPVSFGKIFVGAGPYAALGLAGKQKTEGEMLGEDLSGEEDIKFGSGEDEMKALDFGLNFGGGVRLTSGINLGLNYGLGLSNLSNEDEGKVKNRVWSLTVGYSF
ncbi:porin family protein [Pedobacter sp. SYSU D00535]|uniref:porin family protein n=1 Tax=Pedobacter sp. SYSU D00535 TaxID=2810308 RepID=UPI001A966E8C|nr:porin family protein [Pedobacter sp. SYSU D00535]